MEQQIELNMMDVLKAMLRRWWLILLATAVFAGSGFAVAKIRYVPSYSTTIKMYVNNDSMIVGPTKVSISSGDIMAAQALVNTYIEILKTYETYEKTMEGIENNGDQLSRNYDYDSFISMISSGSLNETEIFYITVTCRGQKEDIKSPGIEPAGARDACLIADAIMEALVERIEKVISSSTASRVEGVHRYSTSSSNDLRTGLVAALLGFLLAAGICICFDVFINDNIQDEAWLSRIFSEEYPVLTVVPNAFQTSSRSYLRYNSQYARPGSRPVEESQDGNAITNINFAAAEAYNRLRTNISYSMPEKAGAKIIAFTSATPSDGKTFTTTHLAYSLAKEGNRILLVECDMRRPSIGSTIDLSERVGLSELLIGKDKDVITAGVLHPNLSVVLSGTIPPNPSDLLSSAKKKDWLMEMSKEYDYIVLDLPPVLAVADPLIVAKYVDAMIFVVKHNVTHKKHIVSSMNQLKMTKTHILGFVYNDSKLVDSCYYEHKKNYNVKD